MLETLLAIAIILKKFLIANTIFWLIHGIVYQITGFSFFNFIKREIKQEIRRK